MRRLDDPRHAAQPHLHRKGDPRPCPLRDGVSQVVAPVARSSAAVQTVQCAGGDAARGVDRGCRSSTARSSTSEVPAEGALSRRRYSSAARPDPPARRAPASRPHLPGNPADLRVVAHRVPVEPATIGADAAIIAKLVLGFLPVRTRRRLAVAGVAAAPADGQALQQPPRSGAGRHRLAGQVRHHPKPGPPDRDRRRARRGRVPRAADPNAPGPRPNVATLSGGEWSAASAG